MKRHVLLVALMLLVSGPVVAQEQAKKFEFGVEAGLTGFTNYPALSVVQDATEAYTHWSGDAYFGMRMKQTLLGVGVRLNRVSTSALVLDEHMTQSTLLLMARHFGQWGERLEPFVGLRYGVSLLFNDLYCNDDYHTYTRWGTFGELEVGMRFNLNDTEFIGLSAGVIMLGSMLSDRPSLPEGLQNNEKHEFGGYQLMLNYGIRF